MTTDRWVVSPVVVFTKLFLWPFKKLPVDSFPGEILQYGVLVISVFKCKLECM